MENNIKDPIKDGKLKKEESIEQAGLKVSEKPKSFFSETKNKIIVAGVVIALAVGGIAFGTGMLGGGSNNPNPITPGEVVTENKFEYAPGLKNEYPDLSHAEIMEKINEYDVVYIIDSGDNKEESFYGFSIQYLDNKSADRSSILMQATRGRTGATNIVSIYKNIISGIVKDEIENNDKIMSEIKGQFYISYRDLFEDFPEIAKTVKFLENGMLVLDWQAIREYNQKANTEFSEEPYEMLSPANKSDNSLMKLLPEIYYEYAPEYKTISDTPEFWDGRTTEDIVNNIKNVKLYDEGKIISEFEFISSDMSSTGEAELHGGVLYKFDKETGKVSVAETEHEKMLAKNLWASYVDSFPEGLVFLDESTVILDIEIARDEFLTSSEVHSFQNFDIDHNYDFKPLKSTYMIINKLENNKYIDSQKQLKK